MVRRVVTGHDADGRSIVVSDGPAASHDLPRSRSVLFDIWRTTETPAPISAVEDDPVDVPLDFEITPRGVRLRLLEIRVPAADEPPYMHRTESVDYVLVVHGEVCMVLDTGELVLNAGDFVIQRGTNHAWVNRSKTTCRVLFVMIGGRFGTGLENQAAKFSPEELAETLMGRGP